ncbi:MAG: NUDIX domain-containing protein [Candidatus Nomurabacteria bacterium]|nr:NUDIX domain-containing protein [Candidatus Nomurabacteria bacterium]
MSEIINTYSLDNPYNMIPMDRGEFYREQVEIFKKEGKATKAVEIVNILIFNSHGELIIQKRSFNKAHNAGLLDKSVGGHIKNGDTPDYTVMVETIQELQTPSIVLKDQEDFNKTYLLLKDYLETIAIISHLHTGLISPIKIVNNEKIPIANKVHIYMGVYDGRIRPVDREAKGILFYSLAELESEMQKTPEVFTDDLHLIMKQFKDEIKNFVEYITK